jgi:hypothetical protein
LPTKYEQQDAAPRLHTPEARSPFWLLKPACEHAHVRLLPRLSWNWTVLLPSDTHRKLVTSNTAVLLPFMTYLLTLPSTVFRWQSGVGKVHQPVTFLVIVLETEVV